VLADSESDTIGVLASGGLDSSILIGDLLRQGRRVQPFYIRTGVVWQAAELPALEQFLAAISTSRLDKIIVLELSLADLYGDHWSLTGAETPGADSPDEAAWYSATLRVIDPAARTARELYRSKQQLGWPSAAPDVKHVAVVEAVCSDRGLVAGDLLILDRQGAVRRCAINDVDATFTSWISNTEVLYAGHRSFETVVGIYDMASSRAREVWKSSTLTVGPRVYPEVAPVPGRAGAFACAMVIRCSR